MSKRRPSTTEMAPRENHGKRSLVIWIILGITVLTYIATVKFEFVYDDRDQIVQNTFVQSWKNLPQYFTGHVRSYLYPASPGNYYRPFFLLWALLNYSLFGLKPVGWHLTTVLVHAAATALSYTVVRKLTMNRRIAAAAALLFGVHPIHIEAVAWVSGVTESLYAVPFLAAFLGYLNSREKHRARWTACSTALYAVALLCKETAIVLPVLVFAHAWIYGTQNDSTTQAKRPDRLWAALLAVLPHVAVALAYLAVRMAILKGLGHATVNLPFSTVVLTWPSLLWFYLRRLAFPVGLSGFYDVPYVNRLDVSHVILPVLGLLLVGAAVRYWQKRWESRELRLAIAWIVVPLLPLLNLSFFKQGEFAHDRYLYVPSLGFVFLVAVALSKLAAGGRRLLGYPLHWLVATLALAGLLVAGTAYQSRFWKDDFTLYSHAIRIAPHSFAARNNLAHLFIQRGEYEKARPLCEQVLRENPDSWHARYNLGYLSYKERKLAEAEDHLLRAIQIEPTNADQYLYLGMTRLRTERIAEAAEDLRRAIARKPHAEGYHFALGVILARNGDCDGARTEFRAELKVNPGNAAAVQELIKCERTSLAR